MRILYQRVGLQPVVHFGCVMVLCLLGLVAFHCFHFALGEISSGLAVASGRIAVILRHYGEATKSVGRSDGDVLDPGLSSILRS